VASAARAAALVVQLDVNVLTCLPELPRAIIANGGNPEGAIVNVSAPSGL